MELQPQGSDPDHPDIASVLGGGGCGFDKSPSGGYFSGAPAARASTVAFGPLPTTATRIRVSTREVLTTSPLPTGVGLPTGRFWFQVLPAGWPTPADGAALDTPEPLSATGEPVAFTDF